MWPFKPRQAPASHQRALTLVGVHGATGDPWGSLASDVPAVSPAVAESLAAVLAAVNAISQTLAALPAYVVKASEAREEVPTHDLSRLIRDGVDDNNSWTDFLEVFVASTLLRGNGAAEIVTDARGRLVALKFLPWENVTVRVRDDQSLLFDYRRRAAPEQRRVYAREDILWLKDRSDDSLLGVPRLHRAGASVAYALSIQTAAQTFSANASRPGGTLNAPGKLSRETAERLAVDWDLNFGLGRKGKTAVLPEGLTWQALGALTAEDVATDCLPKFQRGDIARVFGVPGWVLGDPQRAATYASSREAARAFATQALAPWATRIERAFQATVLGPQFRLVIDLNSLTRGDPKSRWANHQRARMAGILTSNEVRSEEGWPDHPDGNDLAPPVVGGALPADAPDDKPADKPPPSDDGADKIARLDQHRAAHGD